MRVTALTWEMEAANAVSFAPVAESGGGQARKFGALSGGLSGGRRWRIVPGPRRQSPWCWLRADLCCCGRGTMAMSLRPHHPADDVQVGAAIDQAG